MNVYGLMTSVRVSSDKDSIAVIEAFVAERVAAKDREIAELKAENKRLREGLEVQIKDVDRMQKGGYRTPFIVFRGRLRALLENPVDGKNPTAVDNSM